MKLAIFKTSTLHSSILLSILFFLIFIGNVQANYTLDNGASSLHFLSTKNINITESHTFDNINGTLSDSGNLQIEIDLSSVNTLIPIRNERMQKMLFNVADFATASFTAKVEESLLTLAIGESKRVLLEGDLSISGKSQKVSFDILVIALDNGKLSATTVKPTILNATQFELTGGIEALREIAKLAQISSAIPLTFSVEFTKL